MLLRCGWYRESCRGGGHGTRDGERRATYRLFSSPTRYSRTKTCRTATKECRKAVAFGGHLEIARQRCKSVGSKMPLDTQLFLGQGEEKVL